VGSIGSILSIGSLLSVRLDDLVLQQLSDPEQDE